MFPSAAQLADQNQSLHYEVEDLRARVAALKRELKEEKAETARLEAKIEQMEKTAP